MSWETKTNYSEKEFRDLTLYANQSDNGVDNRNRAIALGFTGEDILVAPGAILRLKGDSQIGEHTFIGLYSYINGQVRIGERVLIGPHCSVTSNNHVFNPETKSFQGKNKGAPIEIGDGSWLASGVTVTAGVKIGKGNLICANAVVTKSTQDFQIIAGTPAKAVGEINPETGEYKWYHQEPNREIK